jgi:transcriptional regulator with XRE-family HTH domain
MPKRKARNFGQVIRERRRQRQLTQQEVARRIRTSTAHIAHLEAGRRHPSDEVVRRLAEVLRLDPRDIYLLANPVLTAAILEPGETASRQSAWEQFRQDKPLQRLHNVTADEMEMLASVARMGEAKSPRAFIYILNAVRHALGR